MNTIQLGKSGLKVSEICLGTMTFAREADEETSFRIADEFVERGGFFVDTANIYSEGASEQAVGRWMKARRNRADIVLATKVYGAMGPGPNDEGLSRIHIIREVEQSLRRLDTEVIDLYQIHRWSPETPVEETIRVLDDLVRSGKVRYIGASNLKAFELLSYLHSADSSLMSRFISLQPVYNALNRGVELEILPLCEKEGLGIMAYNPLAGGLLTGKYKRGMALPAGARLEANQYYHDRYFTDQALDIVDKFVAHASEMGLSPAQLALAWVRSDSRISVPIVGARSVEQLTDTLGSLDRLLSAEERAAVPAMAPGRWAGKDPVYDR
jgi:aryl-alcohol dehydrogenase-like predicted oxidoreductase